MPIKDLPVLVTKSKVFKMYRNIPESELRADMKEITLKNRKPMTDIGKRKVINCRNLRHFEWLCLLSHHRTPQGYSNKFVDGELLEDKLKRYPETENFI